jgi:hypothetical protein
LSGNFGFEQIVTAAPSTQRVVRVSADNVTLALGDGTRDFVRVTRGTGNFLLTNAGVAGEFSASVALDVPGVTFSGGFQVRFKTITATVDENFMVNGQPQVDHAGDKRLTLLPAVMLNRQNSQGLSCLVGWF